jgi:hypothetical protein
MRKRIKVTLLPGWADYSHENPEGPATYLRQASEVPGPLQVSLMAYRAGEVPDPSPQELVSMAANVEIAPLSNEVIETSSGQCAFGHYGSAVFRSPENPHMQVWYLSNGYDFILATHICPEGVDPAEAAEAEQIVKALTVTTRPWWKFW